MTTLKEHLEKARRARWDKATPEQRKAHSEMMVLAKARRAQAVRAEKT